MGLLVQLAVMDAANVLFLLFDVFVLRLPSFELLLVTFLAEPPIGLVIAGKALAYSTNQLIEHEMVIDTIAGTPVVVTY